MKFALLGADRDTIDLVQAVVRSQPHQLVAAYDIPDPWLGPLKQMFFGLAVHQDWEALLHETVADAVLVSSHSGLSAEQREQRGDQLRKLTQAGLPILVTYPACEAIVGFEIEMIRNDLGGILVPFHRDLFDPHLQRLIRQARQPETSSLGRLEQVVMERWIPERTLDELRRQLARDTALIRQLVGGIRRVSGLGKAFMAEAVPFNLTASFDSDQQVLCTWSVCPTQPPHQARITLMGTEGQTTVTLPHAEDRWQWPDVPSADRSDAPGRPSRSVEPVGLPADGAADDRSVAEQALALLVTRVERGANSPSPLEHPASQTAGEDRASAEDVPLTWMEACRAQEAAETVERAVARGRTIELFNEEHSEAGTFKGIMAAGSCSLLMLTLLILVLGSVIEGVRLPYARQRDRDAVGAGRTDPSVGERMADRGRVVRPLWIRLWPVYPLLLFLLLQTLNLVFVPPPASGSTASSSAGAAPSSREGPPGPGDAPS